MIDDSYSRDEEAAWIEAAADRYREKTGMDEPSTENPWPAAFHQLARLQSKFDKIEWPPYDWNKVSSNCAPAEVQPLAKQAYRVLRPLVGREGTRQILDNVGGIWSQYRVKIWERGSKGKHEVLRRTDAQIRQSFKRERVGTAIMLLRKKNLSVIQAQRHIAGKRISEFVSEMLSDEEIEDGVVFGDFEDTRKHWMAWRKEAFSRGWADGRAYSAEIDRKTWPDDQFWLDEI